MIIFLSFSRATKAGGCQAAESADSSVLSCWHLDGVPGLSDIDPGQGRPVRRAPSRAHRIDAVGCASSTSEFRCLRSTPPRSSHTLPAVRRRPPHASTSLLIRTVARRRGRSPARCTVQSAESSTRGLLRPRAHFFSRSLSSRRHGIAMPGCE